MLHDVCPVSVGEFFSAFASEFDEPVVVGSPVVEDELEEDELEEVVDVVLDDPDPPGPVMELPSPGDCPGGMNGDCGELVR
jgi:hypothetical protein